jgi:hypothetical protein
MSYEERLANLMLDMASSIAAANEWSSLAERFGETELEQRQARTAAYLDSLSAIRGTEAS